MPGAETAASNGTQPTRSIVDGVLTLIADGHLSPGQRVDQREIAEHLGTSRTPLREALKALEADGILRHELNRGYTVTKLTGRDLVQYHQLRFFLETELIDTMEWPDADGLAALKAANQRYGDAGAMGAIGEMSAANREFHFLMFSWSPNTVMFKECVRIWRVTDAYHVADFSTADRRERVIHDHDDIIKAIETKNRKRLMKIMDTHRSRALELLSDYMGMPIPASLSMLRA